MAITVQKEDIYEEKKTNKKIHTKKTWHNLIDYGKEGTALFFFVKQKNVMYDNCHDTMYGLFNKKRNAEMSY